MDYKCNVPKCLLCRVLWKDLTRLSTWFWMRAMSGFFHQGAEWSRWYWDCTSSEVTICEYSQESCGSEQAGPMWLFRSDFPSCSESAEIWHVYSTLFVLKNVHVFFQASRKIWTKLREMQPPPPLCPSPNNIGFRSLRAKTLHVFFMLLEGDGGEGGLWEGQGGRWTFKIVFEAVFPRLWKETKTFFHRKGVSMPNFSRFWAIWKIAMKSSYRAGLHGALQLLCFSTHWKYNMAFYHTYR